MATSYLTPGIYVEEVSSGARPIEGVGTSTAAFVGQAPNIGARVNEAVAITNWSQFRRDYVSEGPATSTPLSNAVFGFFLNGGQLCYVVNVGSDNQLVGDASGRKGIDVLEEVDAVAIVAAPGYTDAVAYDAIVSHCEKMKDRVAILDLPSGIRNLDVLTRNAAANPVPRRRAGAAGDTPAGSEGQPAGAKPRASLKGMGAVYFPNIVGADPLAPAKTIEMFPSGHIAGVWARTDAERGVHVAPANKNLRGAVGLTYNVTHAEQGNLNAIGVNCIRSFDPDGILIWGARTIAPPGNEWRYLNVRRLFCMIEKSIERSTRWVVFEPNGEPLWQQIRRDVRAFLMLLWSSGALAGTTPDEAFFVQCDRETNPPEVVDVGMVVIRIGVAPVKPAEFVIFRIGQSAAGAEVEQEGGNG